MLERGRYIGWCVVGRTSELRRPPPPSLPRLLTSAPPSRSTVLSVVSMRAADMGTTLVAVATIPTTSL